MGGNYYARALSAERLRRCYKLAPPRVQQYLEAEIDFALQRIDTASRVLELGCGYGRVLRRLLGKGRYVLGIDTSLPSLLHARRLLGSTPSCALAQMDAVDLAIGGGCFERVLCVQNGIAAFGVDRRRLLAEAIRVTRPGGTVLLSSYSEHFWEERLAWFRIQSAHGLIGELDEDATGDGVIVTRDGFEARTVGPLEFESLAAHFDMKPRLTEVDGSSLFCEIRVP